MLRLWFFNLYRKRIVLDFNTTTVHLVEYTGSMPVKYFNLELVCLNNKYCPCLANRFEWVRVEETPDAFLCIQIHGVIGCKHYRDVGLSSDHKLKALKYEYHTVVT